MPLHSFELIVLFLALTIALHFLLNRAGHFRLALAGLVVMSLVFCGWRALSDVELLLASIGINFLIGCSIHRYSTDLGSRRKLLLALGITINLALLGYFKYSAFVLDNINAVMHTTYPLVVGYLPLGISFLTFQQIAYLMDVYRGQVKSFNFLDYCFLCSFFPKTLAGPIIRHGEITPQLNERMRALTLAALAEGMTRFTIGLFKKVVMADTLAGYANSLFTADAFGRDLGMVEAWGGILAYTFQLYFDFSGYTDMALGIARMFGIALPENFNSPYKATNIIDFWKRWHMTLSRFLRDYLYISLGGNRQGAVRQYLNLLLTMVLCGLWHGASWTFVIWGALHGGYLLINHGWRRLELACAPVVGWGLTFLSVAFGWAWFRADTVPAAIKLTASLLGLNGLWAGGFRGALLYLETPAPQLAALARFFGYELGLVIPAGRWTIYPVDILLSTPMLHIGWLVVSGLIVLKLPNALEGTGASSHESESPLSLRIALFVGGLLFLVWLASITSQSGGVIF